MGTPRTEAHPVSPFIPAHPAQGSWGSSTAKGDVSEMLLAAEPTQRQTSPQKVSAKLFVTLSSLEPQTAPGSPW